MLAQLKLEYMTAAKNTVKIRKLPLALWTTDFIRGSPLQLLAEFLQDWDML